VEQFRRVYGLWEPTVNAPRALFQVEFFRLAPAYSDDLQSGKRRFPPNLSERRGAVQPRQPHIKEDHIGLGVRPQVV
jgi:hypothetical protein